jgi:uncharacterized membrane protein YbhN (UPF0104 family)
VSVSGAQVGPRPALDRKKTLIGAAVGVVALVVIFLGVIPQVGSYADALVAIQNMTAAAIGLIVITVVVYNVSYGFPFMAATPGLPYRQASQLNQAAFAISNGIPAGGAFGLGVQYAMLDTYQVAPAAATAAIGAVGVWSIFATLGLPVLGLIAISASGTTGAGPYVIVAIVGLVVLLVMILGFGLIMRSEPLAERLGRLANAIARPVVSRSNKHPDVDFAPMLVGFRLSVVDLVRRRWAGLTLTRLVVSVTQFLILFAALRGVEGGGTRTSFLVAFGAWAVAQIGIMIPITPGGLGTVDAFLIALLTAMGVSEGDATAADLVWRAASYVPQIIIGIACLVAWSRRAAHTFAAAQPTN